MIHRTRRENIEAAFLWV